MSFQEHIWTDKELMDEFLELLWTVEELAKTQGSEKKKFVPLAIDEGLAEDEEKAASVIKKMQGEDLLAVRDETVHFTEKGRKAAKKLIRRKRLAEKLLAEVFDLGPGEIKSSACRFEHILSAEVTDSVCSFLGHPPLCPHGKPIPQGKCCSKLSHHMRPLVMPMKDLEPGSRARIVFIAPRDHSRMDRLSTLGIVPGTEILLHQKRPAFVIRSGEMELALDLDIAGEIYVKIIN